MINLLHIMQFLGWKSRHTPTKFARKDAPQWVQQHRIDAAAAKRAHRRERNLRRAS